MGILGYRGASPCSIAYHPSNHCVFEVQRKNWLPFVFGPEFAMETTPGPECFKMKFSSGNVFP